MSAKFKNVHLFRLLSRTSSTQAQINTNLKPFSEVPAPGPSYPFIGNIFGMKAPDVGLDPTESIKIMKYLWSQYGDVFKLEAPLFRPNIVFLFNPDYAEQIYRAAGSTPTRPGFDALRYVRGSDPLTNRGAAGLLTSDGHDWSSFRSQVQQPMLRPKSTLRYTPDLEEIAEEFIEKKIVMKRNNETKEVNADFLDDLYKWALESVTCLALNARLGCLESDIKEDSHQMKIIRAVSDIFSNTMHLDNSLQLWKYFPSRRLNQFTSGYNTFRDMCKSYIDEAIKEIKLKQASQMEFDGDPSMLELFFERGADESTAIVMALDMMFAGVDTSSHTSGFIMYQLAKHPNVQEKLYNEISAELPHKDSKFNLKSLDKMPYLKAVLKETLRTNPPATANARQIKEPMEIGGYAMPKDVVYVPMHYWMANSPKYIDNPESFRPERWLRTQKDQSVHPFVLLPFGHGPRMCIGRRFAEQEISIFIAKIIQKFKIEWHHEDMKMKTETLVRPATPLEFTFIDR